MKRGVAALLGLSLLAACSRRSGGEQTFSSTRVVPGMAPPTSTEPGGPGAPPHDTIAYDGAPLTYSVTQTLEAGAAPKVDPDLAIVEAARATAAGCFPALEEGPQERSAVLEVTVVPTGAVSRTEVSADPDLQDCLRRVGDGLHFSDRSGPSGAGPSGELRSFSIDVHVRRAH